MEKTATMLIEFTYDDEIDSFRYLEKRVEKVLEAHDTSVTITHQETAEGTMEEAFGVEDVN